MVGVVFHYEMRCVSRVLLTAERRTKACESPTLKRRRKSLIWKNVCYEYHILYHQNVKKTYTGEWDPSLELPEDQDSVNEILDMTKLNPITFQSSIISFGGPHIKPNKQKVVPSRIATLFTVNPNTLISNHPEPTHIT